MEMCYNQEIENLKRQINIQTKRFDIRVKHTEILVRDIRHLEKVNNSLQKEYSKLQEHLEYIILYYCERLKEKERDIASPQTMNKTFPSKEEIKKDKIKDKSSLQKIPKDSTGSSIEKTDADICDPQNNYHGSKSQERDNFRKQVEVDKNGISSAVKSGEREDANKTFWKEKIIILDKKYDYLLKALSLKARYLSRARLDVLKIKETEKENSILKQDLDLCRSINQKLEIELANHVQILMVRNSDLWQRFLGLKRHPENVLLPNLQKLNERISGQSVDVNLQKDEEKSAQQGIRTCPQCNYQFHRDVMSQMFKRSNSVKTHSCANFERLSKYVSMAVDLKLRNLNKVKQAKMTVIDLKQRIKGLQLKVEQYSISMSKMERERDFYIRFTAEICKQMSLPFENLKPV